MGQRLYGLYRRPKDASKGSRWERHPDYSNLAYRLKDANLTFQALILSNALGRREPAYEFRILQAKPE